MISSNYLSQGSWSRGFEIGNYRTAINTRSLSISLFPFANYSSALRPKESMTANVALLVFENLNGNVSALLYRQNFTVYGDVISSQDQWINITSQDSKALPKEFHNAPGFNYSDVFTSLHTDRTIYSRTLYEADPIVVYNTPFFSAPNFFGSIGLMFYSPLNLMTDAPSPLAGSNFVIAGYTTSLNGSGNFSLLPMGEHYASPYTERCFCEITYILGSTPSSKDYVSIHQSDIARFGKNSLSAIWINGTQPVLITSGLGPHPTLPSNEFPFKRLASVASSDGSRTFLYHQMNGTTFAEEQWDETDQIWLRTEYITISYP